MSSAQNAGLMQRTYAWLFAAAANLNDAVIGVEQETTLDSFSPNQPNILVDAHLEADHQAQYDTSSISDVQTVHRYLSVTSPHLDQTSQHRPDHKCH